MNNIFVKLAGGLGNQLFQIAAGYAYSKRYNTELFLDCSEWSGSQGNHPTTYKNTLYSKLKFGNAPDKSFEYSEKRFNYDGIPFTDGDLIIRGYFQSLKYFEECQEEVKNLFQLPIVNCDSKGLKNIVAAHIRRGDYVRHHDIHYICDEKYFVDTYKKYFSSDDYCKIHIYTDSPSMIHQEFGKYGSDFPYCVINTQNELQDLYMLGVYDNIICSNSSFSWWGSYLGCPKTKIFVPDIWFKNFENHDDVYRPNFTKIPV